MTTATRKRKTKKKPSPALEIPEAAGSLTVAQVARDFQTSASIVRRWHAQGRLPGVRLGRLVRFDRAVIERIRRTGVPPLTDDPTREAALARDVRKLLTPRKRAR